MLKLYTKIDVDRRNLIKKYFFLSELCTGGTHFEILKSQLNIKGYNADHNEVSTPRLCMLTLLISANQ